MDSRKLPESGCISIKRALISKRSLNLSYNWTDRRPKHAKSWINTKEEEEGKPVFKHDRGTTACPQNSWLSVHTSK